MALARTHLSADASIVAIDELMDGLEDSSVSVSAEQLLVNDHDVNGNGLSIAEVGGAVGGTVAFDALKGVVTFTPTANFSGAASFSYDVVDGTGQVAHATADVAVTAVDDAPVLSDVHADRIAHWEDLASAIDIAGNVTYSLSAGAHLTAAVVPSARIVGFARCSISAARTASSAS